MDGIVVGKVHVSATGMITRKNASAALGVRPKTMCEWASRGLGPDPVKVGGRIYYRWDEVLQFATHG